MIDDRDRLACYDDLATTVAVAQTGGVDCGGYVAGSGIPEVDNGHPKEFWRTPNLANLRHCINLYGTDLAGRNGDRPLHFAALYGTEPAMITLLGDEGAEIDARGAWGAGTWTPLHVAATFNYNPLIVMALISLGANIEVRDDLGMTPLHLAADANDSPAVVEALLKAGADTEARDLKGLTALHWAASTPDAREVVEALLRFGADIEARDVEGMTPLHIAAFSWTVFEIELLLDSGANRDAEDDDGDTPCDVLSPWGESHADGGTYKRLCGS